MATASFESKYKRDVNDDGQSGFTRVQFGHDLPFLEADLNEMQVMQEQKINDLSKLVKPSGFVELIKREFNGEPIVYNPIQNGITLVNQIALAPARVSINGQLIELNGNFNYDGNDNYILVNLGEAPQTGEREDLIFLEVWYERLSSESLITKSGYVNGKPGIYNLIDERTAGETSRRIGVRWAIRVQPNVNFTKFKDGFGFEDVNNLAFIPATANGKLGKMNNNYEFMYANAGHYLFKDCDFYQDYNLWVAGRPNKKPLSSEIYGNYVYALPLFKVKRRNKTPYSLNNPNGSLTYNVTNNANSELDSYLKGDLNNNVRPDLLYYDYIIPQDLIDLRRTAINNVNVHRLLNDSLNQVLTGTLTTAGNQKLRRVQFGNQLINMTNNKNLLLLAKLNKTLEPFIPGVNYPDYTLNGSNVTYERCCEGYGIFLDGNYYVDYRVLWNDIDQGTIDFFIQPYWQGCDDDSQTLLRVVDAHYNEIFKLKKIKSKLTFTQQYGSGTDNVIINEIVANLTGSALFARSINHVRISWSANPNINSAFIYVNGKLVGQGAYVPPPMMPSRLLVGAKDEITKGCVIEDLIVYKASFEQSQGGDIKYVVNTYWPNLPPDFITDSALLLPSFNGTYHTFSDNPYLQNNTIINGKIKNSVLNLDMPYGTLVSDSTTPEVYNLNNTRLEGYWTDLGTNAPYFTMTYNPDGEELPDQTDVVNVHNNLSKLPDFIEYHYSQTLSDLIEPLITVINGKKIQNDEYALFVTEITDVIYIQIIKISDSSLLYNGELNAEIIEIPGLKLDLTAVELDVNYVEIHDMILIATTQGDMVNDYGYEIIGNLPHEHFSEDMYNALNGSIFVLNEQDVVTNTYVMAVKSTVNNVIKVYEKNSGETLYEGPLKNEITEIPGIAIYYPALHANALDDDAVIIETVAGNIVIGNYQFSENVSDNYNYDANLKDLIAGTMTVTNTGAIRDRSYEIVIMNVDTKTYRVYDKLDNVVLHQGTPNDTVITCIPGFSFIIPEFHENSYLYEAVRIDTFATSGSSPGNFTLLDKYPYVDYHSDDLKSEIEPTVEIIEPSDVIDAQFQVTVVNIENKIIRITSEQIEPYECTVGQEITIIPGIKFSVPQLPTNVLLHDMVDFNTNTQIFTDPEIVITDKIPFIHYSAPLASLIQSRFIIEDLNNVKDNDYQITLNSIDPPKLTIKDLTNNGNVIYDDELADNLTCIPGLVFNLNQPINNFNKYASVIMTTSKSENQFNAMVKFDLIIPAGNGGYDLPNEIMAAGKITNNGIEEWSFNVKDSPTPRKVKYVKPRLTSGLSDQAYDYSSNRDTHLGLARMLIYNISGNGTARYNVPINLYGYPVIGLMAVANRRTTAWTLIKDPMDPTKNHYELLLSKYVMPGEVIQLTLALGGVTFEYDANSKTLITNICKVITLEVESNGGTEYTLACSNKTYNGGLLKACYSFEENIFDKNNEQTDSIQRYVAYVDDKMFIPEALYDENGDLVRVVNYVPASYTFDEGNIDTPFIHVKFDFAPQPNLKIKIPVLVSYQPTQDEILSIWYNYTPYQGLLTQKSTNVTCISNWRYFITTLGSGNKVNVDYRLINNAVNRLPGGLSYSYLAEGADVILKHLITAFETGYPNANRKLMFINDAMAINSTVNVSLLKTKFNIYKNDYQDGILNLSEDEFMAYLPECTDPIRKYVGAACLVVIETGEIMLMTIGSLNGGTADVKNIIKPEFGDLFRLTNIPTIKKRGE